GLDGVADVTQGRARLDDLDAAHHRFVGDVDQLLRLHADLADAEHAAGVTMPAVEDDGDVDVEDIAVLQLLVAGNAVADDMVDGGADRLRETAVVQGRRNGAAPDDEVVAQAVEFARGDARLDVGRDIVERLRRQATGAPHGLEVLGAVDLDATGLVTPIVGWFGFSYQAFQGSGRSSRGMV